MSTKNWTAKSIPDLSGKIAAVTGGYGGVGLETVRALLNKNAHVIILGRSQKKGDDALSELKSEGGKVEFVVLDLEDLASVRRGAEELASKVDHLDMLFNNAGVMIPPVGSINKHGHELQFGCNVLGHYHLTTLLLPLLLASPDGARVVFTSSSAESIAPKGGIDFKSIKSEKKLGAWGFYAQSKLGSILLANELQRQYSLQGIVASSCHPGLIKTGLQRSSPFFIKIMSSIFFSTPETGALNQLYLGTTPEGKNMGGKYFVPKLKLAAPRKEATDVELQKKLWEYCRVECQAF